MYNAKCTVCSHQWQDSGRSRVCPALVDPPVPEPAPIPDPPYKLVRGDGPEEVYLSASVGGLEVVVAVDEVGDLSDLVVVSQGYLRTLKGQVAEMARTVAVYLPGHHPYFRGTASYPCEECGQTDKGATLLDGWYRCNVCGYPSQ
jgi:hypothetical protein